jgi:hypothetical protein
MTYDSDSTKDIDSFDIYKQALDDLGAFLEPSKLVQSDLQNVQNQLGVSDNCLDKSEQIPKSSNDKKVKISESEEIFKRLLAVFTIRDRVQKSLLSNVLENPSTVEIEIHQLDRKLRNDLRTINCKTKPKIKINIMKSLAEFKAQRTVSSNDWWWNYQLNLGWRYSRCWSFGACVCLGFSAVILYKIIYGLTTGQILIQANLFYNSATVLGTAFGTILGFIGLKDIISGQIKDFASSRWQEVNQSSLFKAKSFNRPFTSFLWSSSSLIIFILSIVLPIILNNMAIGKLFNDGETFKQTKNDLERAAYLMPNETEIRKNLAQFYLYNRDYANAIKEYKFLLPDFEATTKLIRLHLLKVDKIINNDDNYDDYTNYLVYVLNASYFSNYCSKDRNINQKDEGNKLFRYLVLNNKNSSIIKECELKENYKDYTKLNEYKDVYLIWLRRTFEFLKMRGWIYLSQKDFDQANLYLRSARVLASETIEGIKNAQYPSVYNNDKKDQDDFDSQKKQLLAKWKRRRAESACLLSLLPLNKPDKDNIKEECHNYNPQYLDDWLNWTYEYLDWQKLNRVKQKFSTK